jgi:bifunctional DNA-binding transcriptional regulator/antitoxin component of YhaV-PrlF toxin-antitoxin module
LERYITVEQYNYSTGETMELIKMSRKGQLVVPQELREALGFNAEDMFLAYGVKDYVLFKKVKLPTLKKEFEELVNETSQIAQRSGITEETVNAEIRNCRKTKRRTK